VISEPGVAFQQLGGKRALVTGAARGIGRQIASQLARAGARVAINDLQGGSVKIEGAELPIFAADVSSGAAVSGMFEAIQREFGGLDILVNNAGVWFREPLLDISEAHWEQVFGTIAKGAFLCAQQAARLMAPAGGGCIVNIASQAGLSYTRGQGLHYHAAKAALIHFTRTAAFELGPLNIRINAIAPGYTETGERHGSSEVHERMLAATPLGRATQPADVAGAVLFLCSDLATAITGQTLLVNGGAISYS